MSRFLFPSILLLSGLMLAALARWEGVSAEVTVQFAWVGVVCGAATLVSQLPLFRLDARDVDAVPAAIAIAIALRGGLTVLGISLSVAMGLPADKFTALALALWYAAFLITEMIVMSLYLASRYPAATPCSAERCPQE